VEIRQARATDRELLRELRLRALADAPDAFASTLDKEVAFPQEVWRQWAEGGPTSANLLARRGGAGVGMAAIFADPSAPRRVHLVAMWVDPVTVVVVSPGALIDHAVRWADERQACEVVLRVADHNRAAWTPYERVGFRPTGERQPLPSNPTLTESLLRLPLRGQ
jgi:GNAT superfamily N-acetyltransferase